jgi:2-dehydro-3-deoxyphosphogluconate aldolase/(4S)-4-hydroxy-2-oxoglutarate aldolase
MLPTGGVGPTTAHEYILAGATALGIGSELVDRAVLDEGRDGELTERARQLVSAIQAARSTLQSPPNRPA